MEKCISILTKGVLYFPTPMKDIRYLKLGHQFLYVDDVSFKAS